MNLGPLAPDVDFAAAIDRAADQLREDERRLLPRSWWPFWRRRTEPRAATFLNYGRELPLRPELTAGIQHAALVSLSAASEETAAAAEQLGTAIGRLAPAVAVAASVAGDIRNRGEAYYATSGDFWADDDDYSLASTSPPPVRRSPQVPVPVPTPLLAPVDASARAIGLNGIKSEGE